MSLFHSCYPIAFSKDVLPGQLYPFKLLNEPLVLFRGHDGKAGILQDRCPHRSTPLSLGKIKGNCIECPYHGWQFNRLGECEKIPALLPEKSIPPKAQAGAKTVIERQGMIWCNLSPSEHHDLPDNYLNHFNCTKPVSYRFEYSAELPIPHELMIENLLDPAHLPFAHDGTISKRKKAAPIDMAIQPHPSELIAIAVENGIEKQQFHFDPPFTVYFDLFFKQSAIRQVHYCLPISPEQMKLNSIFFYQNMPWLRWIPGMQWLQSRMSKKIISQDLAMLSGQKDNINHGAPAWNQAINADNLAQRYRQWFRQQNLEDIWFTHF